MLTRRLKYLAYLSSTIVLASCAQRPEETIQTVTKVFTDLEEANAKAYAPQAFTKAEQAYADAMAEIAAQDARSFLTRSYGRSSEFLAKAKETAEKAKEMTETNRENARQDAGTILEDAKTAFAAAETALGKLKAPRAKLEAIRKTFEEAGATLQRAEQAFASGDFLTAQERGEEAKALIDQVASDMEEARGGKGR